MRKILVLSANPKDTDKLRLDEEFREIDEGLKRASHRDRFDLTSKWAVRERDFYRHMLEVQPHIVHFSGHGGAEEGIVLEDEMGRVLFLPTAQLTGLFKLFASKGLECVVLNACFSEVQAKAISEHVPYVVGMNRTIGDEAAIKFAVAFYDALGAGETVKFAFELGCIQLIGLKEQETPTLLQNPDTASTTSGSGDEVASRVDADSENSSATATARTYPNQSQSFRDFRIKGEGNTVSVSQTGGDSIISQRTPQTSVQDSDLHVALAVLRKLKQDVASTDALNLVDKATAKMQIEMAEAELKKVQPDKSLVAQVVGALKKGLEKVQTLAESVTNVANLIEKVWMV